MAKKLVNDLWLVINGGWAIFVNTEFYLKVLILK